MSAGNAASGARFRVFMISALAALSLGLVALPAVASATPSVASDVFAGTNDVTQVTVNFNATDGGNPPVTYSIVTPPAGGSLGAVNQTPPGSVDYTANPAFAGIDSFTYRAENVDGGSNASATVIVRPNTAIDSGPSGLTNDDTPTFGFSSPQTGTVFECRIDADAFAPCTSPFTAATLPDGAHTFEVRARAGLGGPLDSSPASASFTVDNTDPVPNLVVDGGQDDPTNSSPIVFELVSNEDLNAASVEASDFDITNGTIGSITGSGTSFLVNVVPTADGVVIADPSGTYEVEDLAGNATDYAGNASRTVTYDTTAPTATLQQAGGQADPTKTAAIDFEFTSNENLALASVQVSDFDATNGTVDSVSGSGQSFTVHVTATADGSVDIAPSGTFEVEDIAGNTQASALGADRSVTYDSTLPVVSIDQAAGQSDPTTNPAIEFTLSSDEDLAAGSVTAADFDATNATIDSVTGSGDEYTVAVTASSEGSVQLDASGAFSVDDLVGNSQTSAGSTDNTVLYDTPPDFTLEQAVGQVDPTNNSAIEFSFTADEAVNAATVEASDFDVTNGSVDSVTGSGTDYVVAVTATTDGDVVIAPSATFSVSDFIPNATTTIVGGTDRTVTYDGTPPVSMIDSSPTDPSRDLTPTFAFSANEAVTGFECSLVASADPSDFQPCTSPVHSSPLALGDYRFEVRATDLGGSTGGAATYTWTIEPSAISGAPEQATYFTRGGTPVLVTMLATDNQAGDLSYTQQGATGGGSLGSFSVSPGSGSALYTSADGFAGTDTVTVRVRNTVTNAYTDINLDVVVRPATRLLTGPGVGLQNPNSNTATPTFTFDAVSGPGDGVVSGAGYSCRLDSVLQPTLACASGSFTPAAPLSQGAHTFQVTAHKPVLNEDNQPQNVNFTVDTVAPGAPGLTGTHDLTNNNDLSYTVTLPEGTAECRLIAPGDPSPAWHDNDCNGGVDYAAVADGDYTFEVRTVDTAENRSTVSSLSATVDTVVDVAIDNAPTDGSTDARPTIEFSSSENPDVTYTCRLFPAAAPVEEQPAFAACDSPIQMPFLDQNIRLRFEVHATDPAGNENVASVEWDQANTAPAVPAPDVTVEAGEDVVVHLGSTDADSDPLTYSIVTDPITGGTLGDIDQPSGDVTFSAANDAGGVYMFDFEATDGREGGIVQGTATVRVQPQTVFVTEPPAGTNNVRPTWTFESPAGGTTFTCELDSNGPEACDDGNYTPSVDLTEGPHTLLVSATNGALSDPTPATGQVTIDVTAPDVSIDNTPAALSNDTTPSFEFSSTDPTATFECLIDNGEWAACVSGHPTAALPDGMRNFYVRAFDGYNNASGATLFSWEVDATKPDIEFQAGPVEGSWTNARKPVFEFTEADLNLVPASTVCSVDAQTPVADCLSPWQPAFNLNDGEHTATFESSDAAGNTRSVSVTFRVTTITPTVVIDSGPSSPSGPTASFAFSSTTNLGANGRFECRTSLNGGAYSAWATCASNLELTGLSSGNRTIQVRAVDSAGNYSTGGAVASWSWSTIGTAPDTAITNTAINGSTAAFGFNSPGNPVASFECSLDGAAFAACGSPKSYSGLSVGAHDFAVRAVNAVGTKDASPATHNWSVTAGTAPNTSITRQPPARTTDTGATFEFASSDAGSTFECRLDGGAFEACDSPVVYSDLSLADHTFDVRATSFGGLTDQSPASVTWQVSDTLVDPTPAEIRKAVVLAPKKVKSGKKLTVRVQVSNTGDLDGTAKVCLKTPKKLVKGKGQRCKTIVVRGGTTATALFKLGTKPRKKGKRVKVKVSIRDTAAGKMPFWRGHVTVLK